MRVVRAYAQEQRRAAPIRPLNQEYIGENIRLARISGVVHAAAAGPDRHDVPDGAVVGGDRLLRAQISLGSFVMFNTYMGMLVWPMIALGWVVNLMQRGTASWSGSSELMRERPASGAAATAARSPRVRRRDLFSRASR